MILDSKFWHLSDIRKVSQLCGTAENDEQSTSEVAANKKSLSPVLRERKLFARIE